MIEGKTMLGNARRRQGKHYLLWNQMHLDLQSFRNNRSSPLKNNQPSPLQSNYSPPLPETTNPFLSETIDPTLSETTNHHLSRATSPPLPETTNPFLSETIDPTLSETTDHHLSTTIDHINIHTWVSNHPANGINNSRILFPARLNPPSVTPSQFIFWRYATAASFCTSICLMDPCVFSKFNPALHGKSGTNVTGKGYKRSITINTDMSWHVHIAGKLVPIATNKVLRDFLGRISEVKYLQSIMECVERVHICPGNPQPEFVEIVNKQGE